MTFSVCICTRNRPDELARALASVAASTVPVHEVIVSDDSGDDASRAVAERFGARWQRGPRRGLGPNRNAAARAVTGSHVLFLDDDAELGPDFLALVAPVADATTIVTGRERNRGVLVAPRAVDRLGFQTRPYRPREPLRTIVINATVFPAAVVRALGFDEHLVYGYDEVDFATRAVAAGYRVIACPDAVNVHTPSAVNRDYYAPHVDASRLYVLLKHQVRVHRRPVRGVLAGTVAIAHLGMRRGPRTAARATRDAVRALRADSPTAAAAPPTIAVVVPSYRRPADLERCLTAIAAQERPADAVLVVCRADDAPTREVAARFGARTVDVAAPGQVAALNAGLAAAHTDVVAITDDDAAPHPDWLARLEAAFADPAVGGAGGRDLVHHDGVLTPVTPSDRVGVVQWFGRVVGNHHAGTGPARDVDVLKGANMAFRIAALRPFGFDPRLAGAGAQVHNDLAASLALRRAGWRLRYDPAIAVDHFPAARFDADGRSGFSAQAARDLAHNETLVLLGHLPAPRRLVFGAWAVAVGTRAAPGVLQAGRLALAGDRDAARRLRATLAGRAAGLSTWRR